MKSNYPNFTTYILLFLFLFMTVMFLLTSCAKEAAEIVEEQEASVVFQADVEPVIRSVIEQQIYEESQVDPNTTESYIYVVKHGDWLSTIAGRELGNVEDWPKIMRWNYANIEHPALIYPYDELLLHVVPSHAKPYRYVFDDYIVNQGETLWSVAQTAYGDNYAWVVLLRDNTKNLPYGPRKMSVGARLLVRRMR